MPKMFFFALVLLSLTPAGFSEDLAVDEVVAYSDGNTNYKVIQTVRYVLDTTRLPYNQHYNSIMRGTVRFGDKYYRPNDPAGPVLVDCNSTKMIGVSFAVKRPEKHKYRTKQFDIRYAWTHSAVVPESEKMDHNHVIGFCGNRTRLIQSEFLKLFDEIKVDGVISLEISIGPDVILRNSFELTGCADES